MDRKALAGLAALTGLAIGISGCGGGGSTNGGSRGTLTSSSGSPSSGNTPANPPAAQVVTFPAPAHPNSNAANIFVTPASHRGPRAAAVTPDDQFHTGGGWNALALQTAYGINTLFPCAGGTPAPGGNGGAGTVVAVVDADGYNGGAFGNTTVSGYGTSDIQADLATYSTDCGLPSDASSFLTIAVENGNPANDTMGTGVGWQYETALDVEMVHALAPQAQILLVLAKSSNLNDMLSAVDYASNASVNSVPVSSVSMSWTSPEQQFKSGNCSCAPELNLSFFDFHLQHPGVSYFAATGDLGAAANWPATCPLVVAVGGTVLNAVSCNSACETGWTCSGGGTSAYEARPCYQAFTCQVPCVTCKAFRSVPDVAAAADGVMFVQDGGELSDFYGTSFATPMWAAMGAEAAQEKGSGFTHLNQDIYAKAVGQVSCQPCFSEAPTPGASPYVCNFRDITCGGGSPAHPAKPGYDLDTGLGSPHGCKLLTNLKCGQ